MPASKPNLVSPSASPVTTATALAAPPASVANPEPWVESLNGDVTPTTQTAPTSQQPVNQAATVWKRAFNTAWTAVVWSLMDGFRLATLCRYSYVTGDTDVQNNLLAAIGADTFNRVPDSLDPTTWRDEWHIPGVGTVVIWPGVMTAEQLWSAASPQMRQSTIGGGVSYAWTGIATAAIQSSRDLANAYPIAGMGTTSPLLLAGHSLGGARALVSAMDMAARLPALPDGLVSQATNVYTFGTPAFVTDQYRTPPAIVDTSEPWPFMNGFRHLRWYNPGDAVCDLTTNIMSSQYRAANPFLPPLLGAGVFPKVPLHWSRVDIPVQFGNSAAAFNLNRVASGANLSNPLDYMRFVSALQANPDAVQANHFIACYADRLRAMLMARPNKQDLMFDGLNAANLYMQELGF